MMAQRRAFDPMDPPPTAREIELQVQGLADELAETLDGLSADAQVDDGAWSAAWIFESDEPEGERHYRAGSIPADKLEDAIAVMVATSDPTERLDWLEVTWG